MRAGPGEITRDATVAEMDHEGKLTVLRKGTNGWICTPGNENKVGDPPMCVDELGMQWFMDALAGKPAPTNRAPGLCYMLCGATQHSNDTPFDRTSPAIPIGPHRMVLWPFDAKHCGLLPLRLGMRVHGSCSPAHLTHTFISAGHLGTVSNMHLMMKQGGPCNTPSRGLCAHDRSSARGAHFLLEMNGHPPPIPPKDRGRQLPSCLLFRNCHLFFDNAASLCARSFIIPSQGGIDLILG